MHLFLHKLNPFEMKIGYWKYCCAICEERVAAGSIELWEDMNRQRGLTKRKPLWLFRTACMMFAVLCGRLQVESLRLLDIEHSPSATVEFWYENWLFIIGYLLL